MYLKIFDKSGLFGKKDKIFDTDNIYESCDGVAKDVLNTIFKPRIDLKKILVGIENLIKVGEK